MSWPSSFTVPRSRPIRPATARSNVVLPQPEGPSSDTNSPCATRRSMPPSTVAGPNAFSAPATSRNAALATAWLDRHLPVPALDPLAALLGDEAPVEIVDLDVGGEAERRLGGCEIGRASCRER